MKHTIRWTVKKISQRLRLIEPLVYRRQQPLPEFRYLALPGPETPPPVGFDVDDSQWPVVEPDSYWGGSRVNFLLRGRFQVPADWTADAPVALYLPLGEEGDFSHPEALIYIDGQPYAACDRHHQEILLPEVWRDGASHLLALHGWCGALKQPGQQHYLRPCALVQIDQPTRDFVAAVRVALGVVQSLPTHEPARSYLTQALDDAFRLLDLREPFGDAFYASVPAASGVLRAGIGQAGAPMPVEVVATGHAHIDVAWLWTLAQTRRKAGRTFHTVLRLMEEFPDYHFTQSQPQLYEFVQEDYPALFAAIQERVAEKRWEIIGGMWVEADCNLSGAESLARQFLLGRTFFRRHFGPQAESPVLWLPDVFGYAWNLPQLIRQAGLEYFFTIKIGWSQYNRMPYDTFWWQGLDGTRVLTHYSTTPEAGSVYASTYNASATPEVIRGTWTNAQQKDLAGSPLLMAFGYGDGGGGPTREMLENIRELAAFPASPRVRPGSAADFFRELESRTAERLPVWNGELYLELHRGTYTSQSRIKRANRRSEFLLHDAEFLAAMAATIDPGYVYPTADLDQAWKLVCLNQFHDIIPGSSIGPVYVEALQQHAEVHRLGEAVRQGALRVISDHLPRRDGLIVVNPTSFPCSDLAFWPGKLPEDVHLQQPDGTSVWTQAADGGTWIAAGALPPYSVTPLAGLPGGATPPSTGLKVTPTLLENDLIRVELNEAGDITRIYDRANRREVLSPGALGNQFQAFEDRPLNWDAWDIDIFYDDKMWTSRPAESVTVTAAGPLRGTLTIQRRLLHSSYTQHLSLTYNSPRLDFDTTIDWHERHTLLKVAFPVDILAMTATYEIQWGNVERPTHRNTSWDWARFETCAHKWVDLSEGNYGVSLLNDCKYGHDIHQNVLRLTLLRSPTNPDREADQGRHRFTYSLLPHAGPWDERTIAAAYALNDPLLVEESKAGEESAPASFAGHPFVATDSPNVVIETVKRAQDGNGVIVRLYESRRRRGPVTLTTSFPLEAVWRTNLLEENEAAVTASGNQATFSIRPYEIVTLRLIVAEV